MDIYIYPSWPGSSRPSTSFFSNYQEKTWMAGTRPGMTAFSQSRHGHFLQVDQPRHAFARQRHQRQKFAFRERRFFRRALHLDDAAVAGHHEIGVGIGLGILGIIEVEHRR